MQEFLLKIKELLNHEIILGVVFFLGAIFCAFIFRFVLIRLFYFFLKKIKKKEENSLFQAYFKSFLKPIGNLAFLLSLKFLNAFFPDIEKLSEKDRYGLFMPVVICKKCGLVQTNPHMTEDS